MSKVVKLGNGEVDLRRSTRRRYSVEYKLRILGEVEASRLPGQVAEILRREGLYSSNLTRWREQRQAGSLNALAPVRPGPKARERNPLEGRVKELEKENGRLRKAVSDLTLEKLVLKEAASGNF